MGEMLPPSQQYHEDAKQKATASSEDRLPQDTAVTQNLPQYRYEDSDPALPEYLSPKRRDRDQEVATSVTSSNDGNEEEPKAVSLKWRIVCLIVAGFTVLTVVVGILQFNVSTPEDEVPDRTSDYVTGKFPGAVILRSGDSIRPGDSVQSPSGDFGVRMTKTGDLVLEDMRSNSTIWSAGTIGGAICYMQDDGNVVIRDRFDQNLWRSKTHKHDNSILIVDDGGRIAVRYGETLVWMQGTPLGNYTGPSSNDLVFPVRGTFYYAWYPQTWKVGSGALARFESDLGYYLSGDPVVVESHVDQLEYGNIDVGIISWFGPETNLDIARITQLLDETWDKQSPLKWTVYYEDEVRLCLPHPTMTSY